MPDTLEALLKKYRKDAQRIKAIAISQTILNSKDKQKSKVSRSGDEQRNIAKSAISIATSDLKDTVKGQFGNKVSDILDKQNKMLDKF